MTVAPDLYSDDYADAYEGATVPVGYNAGYGSGYSAGNAGPVDVPGPLEGAGRFYVEIDWDQSGTPAPEKDVTSLVRPQAGAVSLQYGRDQSTALGPTVSGQGQFVLDNRDRRFSPRNPQSPLYGKLKPSRPVHIDRIIGGTIYTLFRGYTDDSPVNPDVSARTVSVTLVDLLARFRAQTISTALHRDLRTGDVINLILDACGWTGGRDLDAGATIIPWWWEDGTDALTAIEKVVRSEGEPALFTVGSDGGVVFRDRHHRLTRDASLMSQDVWYGAEGVEPVMSTPFVYDDAWRNVVNSGTVSVDQRAEQQSQEVWTSDATFTLAAGETKLVTVSTSDPFTRAAVPKDETDFTTRIGTVNVALTRTSGASTTIILTAVGGPAVVEGLRLRGRPVSVANTTQVSFEDASSIADYGPRSFPGDLPWCGPGDAEAVMSLTVARRAQPLPILSVRFVVGKNTARAAAVLPRDLSDRVTVVESETALSDQFFIESVAHELTGSYDHAVTFGLEAAPIAPSNEFKFNVAPGFGAAVFGGGGASPALMFRFDGTAGHRFDQSLFAT